MIIIIIIIIIIITIIVVVTMIIIITTSSSRWGGRSGVCIYRIGNAFPHNQHQHHHHHHHLHLDSFHHSPPSPSTFSTIVIDLQWFSTIFSTVHDTQYDFTHFGIFIWPYCCIMISWQQLRDEKRLCFPFVVSFLFSFVFSFIFSFAFSLPF